MVKDSGFRLRFGNRTNGDRQNSQQSPAGAVSSAYRWGDGACVKTMKTLYLLRHAKSAWNDPALADHDRPLASRGARAATLIGRELRKEGFHADCILCSTARRAVDTLEIVTAQLDGAALEMPVHQERELYLTGDRALLERLRRLPDKVETVMLVGHNPDLHNLAQELAGDGHKEDLGNLRAKFPTAGLAVLEFPYDRWSDIGPRAGRLTRFLVPKKLT
jgi:phosphohistidine phosphatase